MAGRAFSGNRESKEFARGRIVLTRNSLPDAGDGRILEPQPERGCVRRTSRNKCGCPKSPNDPKTRGLAVPLRLVLRTQPRSVSARFWWWFQDAPAAFRLLKFDCHGHRWYEQTLQSGVANS